MVRALDIEAKASRTMKNPWFFSLIRFWASTNDILKDHLRRLGASHAHLILDLAGKDAWSIPFHRKEVEHPGGAGHEQQGDPCPCQQVVQHGGSPGADPIGGQQAEADPGKDTAAHG